MNKFSNKEGKPFLNIYYGHWLSYRYDICIEYDDYHLELKFTPLLIYILIQFSKELFWLKLLEPTIIPLFTDIKDNLSDSLSDSSFPSFSEPERLIISTKLYEDIRIFDFLDQSDQIDLMWKLLDDLAFSEAVQKKFGYTAHRLYELIQKGWIRPTENDIRRGLFEVFELLKKDYIEFHSKK